MSELETQRTMMGGAYLSSFSNDKISVLNQTIDDRQVNKLRSFTVNKRNNKRLNYLTKPMWYPQLT
jgi:hypothetical protein